MSVGKLLYLVLRSISWVKEIIDFCVVFMVSVFFIVLKIVNNWKINLRVDIFFFIISFGFRVIIFLDGVDEEVFLILICFVFFIFLFVDVI